MPVIPCHSHHSNKTNPSPGPGAAAKVARRQRWALRQLQAASVRLGVARLQLRAGLTESAQMALETIHEEIQAVRQRLEGKRKPAPRPAPRGLPGAAVLAGGCR